MKTSIVYNISLTQEEAIGLKIILGKHSLTTKKEIGLSDTQAQSMSNLHDELPSEDEL